MIKKRIIWLVACILFFVNAHPQEKVVALKYGNMDFVPHPDYKFMSACLGEEDMPFKISDDGEILPDMWSAIAY